MNEDLINNCYDNTYGIDLKRYHKEICKISVDEEELLSKLNYSRIVFSDGISSDFMLIIYDNLIYLMGDKTCYPCSKVIQSAYGTDFNWLRCIAMPGDIKFFGETDIRKSGVIVSLFSELIPEIPNEIQFFNFLDRLEYSFSGCNWFKSIYSKSLYVRLVEFWDYKQKISFLYNLGLLYPLELIIYTTYKNLELKNEKILKYFIRSLAESTNKIFDVHEMQHAFENLSVVEIEEVLGVKSVQENVEFNIINDEYFADLLDIDGSIRHPQFVDGVYYIYHMQNRVDLLFKAPKFKQEYIKILKQNFRALENNIRKEKGFENVGSFFMEKLLCDRIVSEFPELTIIKQYSPTWLRPQRVDIFILECNLGVEYNGAQHYLPIDFFGGEEGLQLRKILDRRKLEKCFENGVSIMEISYEEDFEYALNELKKLIKRIRATTENIDNKGKN